MNGLNSPWTVLAIAIGIGALHIAQGTWSSPIVLALGALVILGAIFPPLAILIGAIIILRLLLTNSTPLAQDPATWWNQIKGAFSL